MAERDRDDAADRDPEPDLDPELVAAIAERLAVLRDRIAAAGGGPDVRVIGVTKRHPASVARAAVAAGLVDLGENYPQELAAKVPEVSGARWHMIGQLQSNKVRLVAPLVSMIHSVDRASLVDELIRRAPSVPVLVQVNLDPDPVAGRGGCLPADLDLLVGRARDGGLEVRGLMGVAPVGGSDVARRAFATLAALAGRLDLAELSMGMTGDLEEAVAEGSTMVRVGTALFGPRSGPAPG